MDSEKGKRAPTPSGFGLQKCLDGIGLPCYSEFLNQSALTQRFTYPYEVLLNKFCGLCADVLVFDLNGKWFEDFQVNRSFRSVT